jgi:hypothetical protein
MRVSNVVDMKRNLELYQTLFLDLKSTLKLLHRGATWIFGVVPNTFSGCKIHGEAAPPWSYVDLQL